MPMHTRLSTSSYCKFFAQSTILGSCFFINYALADTLTFSPTAPGISVTGLSGDITTGYADILLPVVGQPTEFFYVDPQGLVHSSQDYSAALGLGARKLTDSLGILGAYVYGDYNHAPDGHGFWFVSPGIERFGDRIDFSANVYLPVGSTQVNSSTFFGDEGGIYDHVFFTGHNEYDVFYNSFEAVGTGVDAEVGYRLPVKNNTKIYVGGYYFDPKNVDHIAGATARLEIPFTEHVNVDLSDGYDNYAHNTFKVGLSYNFGGRHTPYNFKDNLAERMVDPTRRNLIAVSGSAHTAQPIVDGVSATPQVGLVMSNISFFLPSFGPTAVVGDGTFEHPYIGFNQDNVDNANARGNRNFFVQGQVGPYISNDPINLTNDNIYGRESYQGRFFLAPAYGGNRPLFEFPSSDGLIWNNPGNSDVSITGIRVEANDILVTSAIQVNNFGSGNMSFRMDNTDLSGAHGGSTASGIFAQNLGSGDLNLWVNNSVIYGNTRGIAADNGGAGALNVNVNNSRLSNNAVGFAGLNDGLGIFRLVTNSSTFSNNDAEGLRLEDQSNGPVSVILNNSAFDGNGGNGVSATNSGTNTFTLTTNNSSFNNDVVGIGTLNSGNGALIITANHSSFSENSIAGISGGNFGGSLYVIANHSSFENNGLYGIVTFSATSVVNNQSHFAGNRSGDIVQF